MYNLRQMNGLQLLTVKYGDGFKYKNWPVDKNDSNSWKYWTDLGPVKTSTALFHLSDPGEADSSNAPCVLLLLFTAIQLRRVLALGFPQINRWRRAN